jgi:hypothetical protein
MHADDDLLGTIINDGIVRLVRDVSAMDWIQRGPSTSIQSIREEFKDSHLADAVPTIEKICISTNPARIQCERRYRLLCGIFKSIDSELSKLKGLGILLRQGNIQGVSSKLASERAITKSAFHLFHALPPNFLMFMLLWTETLDGNNPHVSIVQARPMFRYLMDRVVASKQTDRGAVQNNRSSSSSGLHHAKEDQTSSSSSSSTSSSSKSSVASGGSACANYEFLQHLLDAIDKTVDSGECDICSKTLSKSLSGSGALAPTTLEKIGKCPLALAITNTRKKVQNLNKSIAKEMNLVVDPHMISSTSPILKQIISMVALSIQFETARHLPTKKPYSALPSLETFSRTSDATRSIINLNKLTRPFYTQQMCVKSMTLPRTIRQLDRFVVEPLSIEELLSIPAARSIVVSITNRQSVPVTFSVHKTSFPARSDPGRDIYFMSDSFTVTNPVTSAQCISAFMSMTSDGIATHWRESEYGRQTLDSTAHVCVVDTAKVGLFMASLKNEFTR